MKTKKFGKKLELNKKTVAHLGSGKLRAAKGGEDALITRPLTCFSCETCFGLPTCVKTCPLTGDPCLYCAIPIDR